MKKSVFLVCTLVLSTFCQVSLAQRDHRDRGGSRERMIRIYRVYNGTDHMMSFDPNEASHLGYRGEGHRLSLFADAGRDRNAVYRCKTRSNDHFESMDRNCEDQSRDFLLGYVQENPDRDARTAVYRCNKSGDHLTTVDRSECDRSGYYVEFILGYVR